VTLRHWRVGVSVVACLSAGAACRPKPPAAPQAARNLVLVTIDTLRADRLGTYGNATVATPNMDRLAREGAVALHTSVQVPLTRPSHVSLLSGLYPGREAVPVNGTTLALGGGGIHCITQQVPAIA